MNFLKKYFLPLTILFLLMLLLSAAFMAIIFLNSDANWPEWARILFPALIVFIGLLFFNNRIARTVDFGSSLWGVLSKKNLLLFLTLPVLGSIVFQPLAKSLRYNFGTVLTLSAIKDLKAFQRPAFLEVGEYYADRMQVIPFQKTEEVFGIGGDKVRVNLLFLVPVFQREEAYETAARAWLVFRYQKLISKDNPSEGTNQDFINESIIHLKRLDLSQFQYFEDYPRGEMEKLFKQMSQIHQFYKSGFSNIYLGQDVDRDILSAHYFQYFLFLFGLVGIPGLLLISLLLMLINRFWNSPE